MKGRKEGMQGMNNMQKVRSNPMSSERNLRTKQNKTEQNEKKKN